MSALYNLEPQPTAKLILNTTSGDIALELFAKQTPLASRNFLQHCLDGYYNNTIFHRLVPGFIVQGGDPTGTGHGGTSAIHEDGSSFEDEFHSRLKFNRRGLLGMANDGKDRNGSQFFLTLGATPELQGKHTMFGRVEGDTIYNLAKMGEVELSEEQGGERPMYPTKITGAEVLVNPFPDMIAKVKEAPKARLESGFKKDIKKRKKPAGKNVLSFGGDEGDEDAAPVLKKSKANPKFVSVEAQGSDEREETEAPASSSKRRPSRARSPSPPPPIQVARKASPKPVQKRPSPSPSPESEAFPINSRKAALDKINAEIVATKASMRREVDSGPKHQEKTKSALEAMIPETATRGRKRGKVADEKGALDIFNSFKLKLKSNSSAHRDGRAGNGHYANGATSGREGSAPLEDDEEAVLCDLHFIANCQSCKSWDNDANADGEAENDNDADWMTHTLSFAKDTLGKDLEWKKKMEEIEVIDPREKARSIKQNSKENRKEKSKI